MKVRCNLDDEVLKRVHYNREENERYFNAIMQGMTFGTKMKFQQMLLDGMFSVIEANDFKMICLKIVGDLGGVKIQ
jgi:UDP-galactopyranose mutase